MIFKNPPLNSNVSRGDGKIQSPMLTHEESKVSDNSWSSVVSNAPNAFLLKRAHIYKAGEIDLFVMHR